MVDTNRLKTLIRDFEFHTPPSNGNPSATCTVGELNKVISNIAKVLKVFVEELENE